MILACSLSTAASLAAGQAVAVVEIQVSSDGTGMPLAGAQVVAISGAGGSEVMSSTDERGIARLRGLTPGEYDVRISAVGFRATATTLTVRNGHALSLDVPLTPAPIALEGITAEGVPSSLEELPGAIVLTPGAEGAEARTLSDVLERAPGVQVVRQGGPGSASSVRIRGSSSDQVLVLVDGVRLNSALSGETDLSQIDLAGVKRIVVLTGSAAARFGGGALAGAILVETDASFANRFRRPTLSLQSFSGSFGERSIGVRLTSPLGRQWAAHSSASWTQADGDFSYAVPAVRGGGEAARINAAVEQGGFRAAIDRTGDRDRATLRIHANRSRRGSPGTTVQPSSTGRQEQTRVGLSLGWERDRGPWGINAQADLDWNEGSFRDPTPPFGTPYDESTDVTQVGLTSEGWLVQGEWTIRGGATATQRSVTASSLAPGSRTRFPEGGVWTQISSTKQVGHYNISTIASLRADAHALVRGIATSPGLSVVVVRGSTEFEFSARNAFSPPSLHDLFFQEGVLVEANPNLEPERVRGELTASLRKRVRFGNGVRAEIGASGYLADIDGMILWFPDHRFVWSPNNYDVRRRGVDGRLSLETSDRGTYLRSNLAWNKVTYSGPVLTGPLTYRPEFAATVEGGATIASLTLSGTLRYLGKRRSTAGSDLNLLDPYSVLDLGVSHPISWNRFQGQIEAIVRNALNTHASFLVDYPIPSRGWGVRFTLQRQPTLQPLEKN